MLEQTGSIVYDILGGDLVINNPYYREINNDKEATYHIDFKFWNIYMIYLQEVIENKWLQQSFGDYAYNRGDVYIQSDAMERKTAISVGSRIDFYTTVYSDSQSPTTMEVLSVIEFIYDNISECKIEEILYQNAAGYVDSFDEKITYDASKARYQYTIDINKLFKLHSLKYKLKGGRIQKLHSEVMDKRFDKTNISSDEVLRRYVYNAIEQFKTPGFDSTEISLNLITQAITRCTTLRGNNKKQSIQKILDEITDDSDLNSLLNDHWKSLQKIGNDCLLRHSEHSRIEITDPVIQEFLFYSYFNMIRLILQKLDMLVEHDA